MKPHLTGAAGDSLQMRRYLSALLAGNKKEEGGYRTQEQGSRPTLRKSLSHHGQHQHDPELQRAGRTITYVLSNYVVYIP